MLAIRDLTVRYAGRLTAVHEVDLDVARGQIVALVGESGSGKSTVARALLGLLPADTVVTGSARLDEVQLVGRAERDWRGVRGRRIGVVPQGAMSGLNPVRRVDAQLLEMIGLHTDLSGHLALQRARELIELVRLDPAVLRCYAHQLSGGMRQRVGIALALAGEPDLIVADEPTTGLDAVTQEHVLSLLVELRARAGVGLLVISHDLPALMGHADQVAVMYAGRVVEVRPAGTTRRTARHPYTRGLIAATAAIDADVPWATVPGSAPPLDAVPAGCPFVSRCPVAVPVCTVDLPVLTPHGDGEVACHRAHEELQLAYPTVPDAQRGAEREHPAVRVQGLGRTFHGRHRTVHALVDVDLELRRGEIVGLVGESGSGKSTLARIVLGLVRPSAGTVEVDGVDIGRLHGRRLRSAQRRIGFVPQDPYDSLHPAMNVEALVGEPLTVAGVRRRAALPQVKDALASAGLPTAQDFLDRVPGRLSGGQRQRVAIARALVSRPALLVADEATSMLDVSTRAGIAITLRRLADQERLAVLFVTHDIGEAVHVCDRILVLRAGRAVESGVPARLVSDPEHPYTQALVGAVRRRAG